MMTLEKLAERHVVEALVRQKGPRWRKPSQDLRRSDGVSIGAWFDSTTKDERIDAVRVSMGGGKAFSPLLRFDVPKKPGSTETRPIEVGTVEDTARFYLVSDWLRGEVEKRLSPAALAYRQGVGMVSAVRTIQKAIQTRPYAIALDIRGFFDSIPRKQLGAAVERLDAEERLKELVLSVSTVPSIRRGTREQVVRQRGIPQGLPVSPLLANLMMAEFDRHTAHVLARFQGRMWRYSDDILCVCSSARDTERAERIIKERIQRLGFQMKEGAAVVDLREAHVTWLGLGITQGALFVPDEVIERKAHALSQELRLGLRSADGVKASISGMKSYYGQLLDKGVAEKVIEKIVERLDSLELSRRE